MSITTDSTPKAPLKKCNIPECGAEYPATLEYWHKQKNTRDGLKNFCKKCANEKTALWRAKNPDKVFAYTQDYRIKNREKILETSRLYWEANRDRLRENHKLWKKNNRERTRLYDKNRSETPEYRARARELARQPGRQEVRRKWRLANSNRNRQLAAEWQRKNPDKVKASYLRRQARKKNVAYNFTSDDWNFALAYFNGCCAYCGAQQNFWHVIEMDHWIPVSSPECPGTIPENIIPACRTCNASKSDNLPTDWLNSKFGNRKAAQIIARIRTYFESLSQEA